MRKKNTDRRKNKLTQCRAAGLPSGLTNLQRLRLNMIGVLNAPGRS
jgi:hypothetical protein